MCILRNSSPHHLGWLSLLKTFKRIWITKRYLKDKMLNLFWVRLLLVVYKAIYWITSRACGELLELSFASCGESCFPLTCQIGGWLHNNLFLTLKKTSCKIMSLWELARYRLIFQLVTWICRKSSSIGMLQFCCNMFMEKMIIVLFS